MTRKPKAIIVGGGIGGLCAAIALKRIGWTATVFEQAPELREVGSAVQTWPNASNAMDKLGILEGYDAAAEEIVDGQIGTRYGEPMICMHVPTIKRKTSYKGYSIHRHEFLEVLMSYLDIENDVIVGARSKKFEETSDGVRLTLEDGRTVEGDLLIGADGLNSQIRSQLGTGNQPRYAGYIAWRGLLDWTFHKRFAGYFGIYVGNGGNVGFYPMTKGRTYWFVTKNKPPGEPHDPVAAKKEIQEYVSGWADPVPEMIDRTPTETILRNDISDLMPTKVWGKGRVTLMGDAAHATTPNIGQGACMAVEDAVALAARLQKMDDLSVLPSELRKYERERYDRTHWIVTRSRMIGEAVQLDSPIKEGIRDAILKHMPPNFISQQTQSIYLYDSPRVDPAPSLELVSS